MCVEEWDGAMQHLFGAEFGLILVNQVLVVECLQGSSSAGGNGDEIRRNPLSHLVCLRNWFKARNNHKHRYYHFKCSASDSCGNGVESSDQHLKRGRLCDSCMCENTAGYEGCVLLLQQTNGRCVRCSDLL